MQWFLLLVGLQYTLRPTCHGIVVRYSIFPIAAYCVAPREDIALRFLFLSIRNVKKNSCHLCDTQRQATPNARLRDSGITPSPCVRGVLEEDRGGANVCAQIWVTMVGGGEPSEVGLHAPLKDWLGANVNAAVSDAEVAVVISDGQQNARDIVGLGRQRAQQNCAEGTVAWYSTIQPDVYLRESRVRIYPEKEHSSGYTQMM